MSFRTAFQPPFRLRSLALRAALIGGNMLAITACQNSDAPAVPAKLAVNTPTSALVGTVGTFLPGGVTVQVLDAGGAAIPGALVSFVAMDGSNASAASIVADANGLASVNWQLGTTAGTDSLQAVMTNGVSTYLVATAQPAAVAQLVSVSGDQQVLAEGASSAPITVKALDQYGNPVPGATVTWTDQNGGALSATSTVTDANGVATVTLTTDAAPEQYAIVAVVATNVSTISKTFTEISQ